VPFRADHGFSGARLQETVIGHRWFPRFGIHTPSSHSMNAQLQLGILTDAKIAS